MHLQMARDGGRPPFLYVIIAQDLRLKLKVDDHSQLLFGDVWGLDELDGAARNLGEQTASSDIRTKRNASALRLERSHEKSQVIRLRVPSSSVEANLFLSAIAPVTCGMCQATAAG